MRFRALSCWELYSRGAWPRAANVFALLRFALPFLPGGLGFLLMQHGDRFFLLKCFGEEEVATYGLGYKLALGVGMFSLGPLYMVWSSSMYRAARSADAPYVFGRAFTRILAAYALVGLGLCLFQDEVVRLLGGGRYGAAVNVIGIVVLAGFCQTAAALMDAGFYVSRRSGLKLGITLSATAVMLLLYCLLIPRYGSVGAAAATLGGFAFLFLVTWVVSQRVFPVRYEWRRVFLVLVLAGGTWAVSRLVPATWSWAPVKLTLYAAVPLIAWQVGLVARAEKTYLRDIVLALRSRLLKPLPQTQASRSPLGDLPLTRPAAVSSAPVHSST